MGNKLKCLPFFLLAAFFLHVGGAPANASDIGSLTLVISDKNNDAIDEFDIYLIRVADADGKLEGVFVAANISPEKLTDDKYNAENSKKLLSHARSVSCKKRTTDSSGRAAFEDIDKGVYLVYTSDAQNYVFEPFLVRMPVEISGSHMYDIVSKPKVEEVPGAYAAPELSPVPGPGDVTSEPSSSPGAADPSAAMPAISVDPSDPVPSTESAAENDPMPSSEPASAYEAGSPEPETEPEQPPADEIDKESEDEGEDRAPVANTPGADGDEETPATAEAERRRPWLPTALGAALVAAGVLQLVIGKRKRG